LAEAPSLANSTTATPQKRKTAAKLKTPTSTKGTNKKITSPLEVEDDEEGFQDTPTKRVKTLKVEPGLLDAPQFKMEKQDQKNGLNGRYFIDLEHEE